MSSGAVRIAEAYHTTSRPRFDDKVGYSQRVAGPIGVGVHRALAKQRPRRRERSPSLPPPPGQGWWLFVMATLCLSWLTAGLLPATTASPDPDRLLEASLFYAATMGWSPLCAAYLARRLRAEPPAAARRPRWADVGLALALASGLALAAMAIALLVGEPATVTTLPITSTAIAAVAVLCVQAVTEEYGWRGAPLDYAIERWGARTGLVVHGVAWGAWYAPLFVFSTPNPRASLAPAGEFLVTCLLLGIVLGWLRLRSRSILPSALANALLTIVAGLPLLLQQSSVGLRDAIFRWPGWPALGIVAVLVLVLRGRDLDAPPAPINP